MQLRHVERDAHAKESFCGLTPQPEVCGLFRFDPLNNFRLEPSQLFDDAGRQFVNRLPNQYAIFQEERRAQLSKLSE